MSIHVDSYWNIIAKKDAGFEHDVYINMSGVRIRKLITSLMKTYVYTTYKEPAASDEVPLAARNLRDILRIIHHHYRLGRSICVFCYYGINRSASCKYAYHKFYLGDENATYEPCNMMMFDVIDELNVHHSDRIICASSTTLQK